MSLLAPIAAAFALAPLNCAAGANSSSCDLDSVLHVLYIVAGMLGFVLLLVIAITVHVWRKNRREGSSR